MNRIKLACITGTTFALLVIACGSSTTTPTTPAPGTDPYAAHYPPGCAPGQPGCTPTAPPPGYPATAAPGYPATAAPGYPPPAAPGYPQPGAPAPAPAATMAVPGPLALPCQNDSACIMGRCNTQYGKCAFPCQSAADCAAGASCNTMSGLCLPGGG